MVIFTKHLPYDVSSSKMASIDQKPSIVPVHLIIHLFVQWHYFKGGNEW